VRRSLVGRRARILISFPTAMVPRSTTGREISRDQGREIS
jgi:hypothetical protein